MTERGSSKTEEVPGIIRLSEGRIIGEDISHIPGYGAYKYETHCVPAHTRAKECPFIEETK